jgi:hypothetical protein
MATRTALTDWLQAIGGFGAAIAAVVLALLAYKQMRAGRDQADAAQRQVGQMAKDAESERQYRESEDRRRDAEQERRDQVIRDQIAAVAGIAPATREASRDAARAQLQPIVFAHAHGPAVQGPNDELDLGEDDVAFLYYLSNEGIGPALNIAHGVECGGVDHAFGGGMEFRTARAGEFLPPLGESATQPVPSQFLRVVVAETELPATWRTLVRTYWVRFENVFGEQFETRNPNDPRQSAAFMRMTPLDSPST